MAFRALLAAAAAGAAFAGGELDELKVETELALIEPELLRTSPALEASAAAGAAPGQLSFGEEGYRIWVDPAVTTIEDGEIVNVYWNISRPSHGDWIAVYSPASANISAVVPVKYTWIDGDVELASGSGVRTVQLINMRADYGFVLFTGGLLKGVARARAAKTVEPRAPDAFLRPRVLPTGNPDAFTVRWTSGNWTGSAAGAAPALQWGAQAGGPYTSTVPATTEHLGREDLCGAPATTKGWRDLGLAHSAVITGALAAAAASSSGKRLLYYRIGDAARGVWGPEQTLRVPPAPGATYPTRLIAFDDLGRGSFDRARTWSEYGSASVNTSQRLAERFARDPETGGDLVWHVGDISYATGYLAVWDWWLYQVTTLAGGWANRVPYLVQTGNHESGQTWPALPDGSTAPGPGNHYSYFNTTDAGGECGVALTHVVPFPSGATADAPWHYYETGPFALVSLSTEHNLTTGSPQWLWLESTLKAVNRTKTPFLLLGAHRPMYINSIFVSANPLPGSPDTGDQVFAGFLLQHLEPLTMKYKVTLAIYGHNHAAQRFSAAYANRTITASVPGTLPNNTRRAAVYTRPRATVHVVWGTGGADYTRNCAQCNAAAPMPNPEWEEWTAYYHGFGILTAISPTVMQAEYVATHDGDVVDAFVIEQDLTQTWADEDAAPGGGVTGLGAGAEAGIAIGALVLVGAAALVWASKTGRLSWAKGYRATGSGAGQGRLHASSSTTSFEEAAGAPLAPETSPREAASAGASPTAGAGGAVVKPPAGPSGKRVRSNSALSSARAALLREGSASSLGYGSVGSAV